jgi:hypothetical protein
VDRFDGDTYRAVYTVKFAGVVYVRRPDLQAPVDW